MAPKPPYNIGQALKPDRIKEQIGKHMDFKKAKRRSMNVVKKDIGGGLGLRKPTAAIVAAAIVATAVCSSLLRTSSARLAAARRKMRNQLAVRRILHMRNYEVYKVCERPGFIAFAYLLVLDMRRSSTIDDFPWIPREDEDWSSFGRSNLITSIMVHHDDLDEHTLIDVEFVASCLSELDDSCDWTHYVEKIESKDEFDSIESDLNWLHAFDGILEKRQFKVDVSGITEESFKYLSQD